MYKKLYNTKWFLVKNYFLHNDVASINEIFKRKKEEIKQGTLYCSNFILLIF